MITNRKIIRIDEEKCDGCGLCVTGCDEGALQIIDGKARLVKENFCDGLGACIGECPQGALTIEERPAEDFEPEAVKEHLKKQGRDIPDHLPTTEEVRGTPVRPMGGGCPGSQLRKMTPCGQANQPKEQKTAEGSSLSHWPVQLRLVPPTAPFLQNADVLLTADCVPVALPGYHSDYVAGKVVLMGCPKFDNQMEYANKLADMVNTANLNSITVMEMEVPCCSTMSVILDKAFEMAGRRVPVTKLTVSLDGRVINTETIEA